MTTITLDEAKSRLAELLQRVEGGEDVLIVRDGCPVARLSPAVSSGAKLRSLADFRARMPKLRRPSADLLRDLRDQGP